VIVGLHRQIQAPEANALALACVDAAAESGIPVDPRVFLRDPPSSTHPAGQVSLEWRVRPRRAGGGELWEPA
jgi:hypothetical protein